MIRWIGVDFSAPPERDTEALAFVDGEPLIEITLVAEPDNGEDETEPAWLTR